MLRRAILSVLLVVMSAAVVHAALTEPFSGKLALDYTGGHVRDEKGRVSGAMRVTQRTATDDVVQQVMDRLRRESYREARLFAERLPDRGKAGFVRQAAEALYLWDEFDYAASFQILRRLSQAGDALLDDEGLLPLIRLLKRLLEPGRQLDELQRTLDRIQGGQTKAEGTTSRFPLLVADTLENSLRRMREGRATDSVLRSYRAVEVAVQARLLRNVINPWRPDWQSVAVEMRERYLSLLKTVEPPKKLSLYSGWTFLEAAGQTFSAEMARWRDDLQQCRNGSYLEHGYQRLNVEGAQRLNGHAAALCAELLGDSLETARAAVRHSW